MTSTKMEALFPTPVWIVDLEFNRALALNLQLARDILALIEPRPPLQPGVNWQTDPVVHELPQFREVTRLVLESGRAALQSLRIMEGELTVTGAWANVNPQGGQNSFHSHPNNFFGAVYYVQIPEGTGALRFLDPRPQPQIMMPRNSGFTPFTANEVTVEAKPGRLVVFPAWLQHAVPPNPSQSERISIAFNLMFKDFTRDFARPIWRGSVAIER